MIISRLLVIYFIVLAPPLELVTSLECSINICEAFIRCFLYFSCMCVVWWALDLDWVFNGCVRSIVLGVASNIHYLFCA